jgi:hypothetical protein
MKDIPAQIPKDLASIVKMMGSLNPGLAVMVIVYATEDPGAASACSGETEKEKGAAAAAAATIPPARRTRRRHRIRMDLFPGIMKNPKGLTSDMCCGTATGITAYNPRAQTRRVRNRDAVMAEADAELGLHGSIPAGSLYRSYQEALKNALDKANNNSIFVQPGPCGFSFPEPT